MPVLTRAVRVPRVQGYGYRVHHGVHPPWVLGTLHRPCRPGEARPDRPGLASRPSRPLGSVWPRGLGLAPRPRVGPEASGWPWALDVSYSSEGPLAGLRMPQETARNGLAPRTPAARGGRLWSLRDAGDCQEGPSGRDQRVPPGSQKCQRLGRSFSSDRTEPPGNPGTGFQGGEERSRRVRRRA